jgi:hypothetical protein
MHGFEHLFPHPRDGEEDLGTHFPVRREGGWEGGRAVSARSCFFIFPSSLALPPPLLPSLPPYLRVCTSEPRRASGWAK